VLIGRFPPHSSGIHATVPEPRPILRGVPLPPRRPDPEPLPTDTVRIVWVGIAAFAVALVVLLVGFRDALARHDAEWWLWACVAGIGLGLIGQVYLRRLGRR
jgi:hypothetical protein